MIEIAKATMATLALLTLVGGIMGFVKAKSNVSLVVGITSAIAFLISYMYTASNPKDSVMVGDIICCFLFGLFIKRLKTNKKFMPSGLLLILYGIGIVILSTALTQF